MPMETERKEYLEPIRHEQGLINRRLTWLLTSQSMLFAAYGIMLTSEKLKDQTPCCR